MKAHQKHVPTKIDKILSQDELKFIKKMIWHLEEQIRIVKTNEMTIKELEIRKKNLIETKVTNISFCLEKIRRWKRKSLKFKKKWMIKRIWGNWLKLK